MSKRLSSFLVAFILINLVLQAGFSSLIASSYGQLSNETINSDTVQNFRSLQQASINNPPLQYAVFFVTENETCTTSEYKSLKFYQVVTDEYLTLYQVPHDLTGSLCVPFKNYESYFSGLSTYTLPVIISDNTVGQQLVQQGYYGLYEFTGTDRQVIYVCSCDPDVESWTGAWILSHELSHFALHYFGEPDIIYVDWVHYIQALEYNCTQGNFSVVCPQYSTAVTSPSGNQIPVMEIFGQGPTSYNMPSNAPQSEVSSFGTYGNNHANSNSKADGNIGYTSSNSTQKNISGVPSASSQFGILQTDHKEYDVSYVNSTIVKVSGAVYTAYPGDTKITIIFTLPDGSTKGSQIAVNSDGSYYASLPLDSSSQKGTYSVSASYAATTIGALTFTVKEVAAYNPLLNNKISTTPESKNTSSITSSPKGTTVSTSGQMKIPSWIKNTAKWWSEDSVGDNDFLKGIQYLVEHKIILVPTVQVNSQKSQGIPTWVKNTAKWWAENQVGDPDFVKGIEYLVQNGIIQINNNQAKTITHIENLTKTSIQTQATNEQQSQTPLASAVSTVDNFNFKSIYSNPDNYKNNWIKFVGKVNHLQSDQNIIQFDIDPNSSDLSSQVFVALVNNSTSQLSEGDCLQVEGHVTGSSQYTYAVGSATNLQMTGEKIAKISCLDAIYPAMKIIYPSESQQAGNVKITVNKVEFAEKHTRVYITIENLNTNRKVTFFPSDSHIVQGQSQYSYSYTPYGSDTKDIDITILPNIVENGYIFYDPVPQNSFKLLLEADEEFFTSDLNDPNFSIDQLDHKFTFEIPVQ